MVQVQSKLLPITTSCIEYVHPWTHSCPTASAELLIVSSQDCLRIYTIVYTLSLLMRGRIPNLNDIKRTVCGIIQSSAFLTTSAFTYSMFLCMIRKTFGTFNFLTVSYVPAFMSSVCAILLERPSRRGLLSLYVSNVATETLWNMLASRKMVRPIPYGECLIFGVSTSILMYYYRLHMHSKYKDSIFDVIKFAVGDSEVLKNEPEDNESKHTQPREKTKPKFSYSFIQLLLQKYVQIISKLKSMQSHALCKHNYSCLYNTLSGGTKLFSIGLGIQVTLKLLFQSKKLWNKPHMFSKIFFNKDIFKLGLFLGGFTTIFKLSLCVLRHLTNNDTAAFAIPAGLLASTAFAYYPDNSIALYIMWKMLQISYNWGAEEKYLPTVPGFTILLYCTSTALLFHAATLEPLNLRPSYWKFLHSLSGGRIALMDRKPFDVWGLETSKALELVSKMTNTDYHIKFRM